jgi:hypothetical protein
VPRTGPGVRFVSDTASVVAITRAPDPIRCRLVVVDLLMAAAVVVIALPAFVLGLRGLARRSGHYSSDVGADRISLVLLVLVRSLVLLLVLALSAVTLVSTIGAAIKDVELHGLVYVFFVLDLLLAVLVLLTFGRRDRRRARRRATPARR